jgi:hypothetical protein
MDTKSAPCRQNRRQQAQEIVKDLVLPYLEQLDTPRALSVWLMFRDGEHRQLLDLRIDPLWYEKAEDFRKDYCATELLHKSDLLDSGIDTRAVAVEKAREAEQLCSETNVRFHGIQVARNPCDLFTSEQPGALAILLDARQRILKVLGSSPPRSLPSFSGWSPGRTTQSKSPKLSALEKFQVKPDVTAGAYALGINFLNDSPLWASSVIDADGACSLVPKLGTLKITEGSVGLVVPKNAKTGRFICYEPHLNIAMQLSVGKWLRRRLLTRCGIDLDDQSINGALAVEGSKTGRLATIDLSSASDTISRELVKFLLPEEWYHLLNRLRSRQTFWPDTKLWHVNLKFSSMGNGFTFELESLIFYAIAWASMKHTHSVQPFTSGRLQNLSVYGDDIVVDKRSYSTVVMALESAGFRVNNKKSYVHGLFRESCGMNAFAGFVVNPPRIRAGQRGLSLVVSFHNRIREHWAAYLGYLPREVAQLLAAYRARYPGPLGPQGFGDGHYHVNLDEACPTRAGHIPKFAGWDGWFFKTRRPFQQSRLTSFLDGSGSCHFRSIYAKAALLAATAPRKPYELERTLLETGSYTKSLLRVFTREWEDLLVLD